MFTPDFDVKTSVCACWRSLCGMIYSMYLYALCTRLDRSSWLCWVRRLRSLSCLRKLSSSEEFAIQKASAPAMAFCFCKDKEGVAVMQTQHLADGTFRLLLSPDLPGSPSLSWPPFCLWSVLHCASAPWREGRVCVGEQIVPQHRGRRRARAWSEPWSCWCNVGLQTGSSPQLEKERNQQGAPAHSETEGSCAESWRSGLYSPFSQRMILIGSPGRSERSEYGLPVWFEAKTRRDIMTNKLWFTFFTKRRLTGVGLPPRLSFRCKHASVDQRLFLWPEC